MSKKKNTNKKVKKKNNINYSKLNKNKNNSNVKQDKLTMAVDQALKLTNQKIDSKQKELIIQIFKFVVVGGIATIIDWTIYTVCCRVLNIYPLISNIISFSISVIYNYWASCKYVFKVTKNKSKKRLFIEFFVFAILGFLLSELLLWIFFEKLGWDELLVKIFSTAIVMVFNFITRKIFLEDKN